LAGKSLFAAASNVKETNGGLGGEKKRRKKSKENDNFV